MEYKFNKFDLICEDITQEIISEGLFSHLKQYSSTWTFNEEFSAIYPFILNKIEKAFKTLSIGDLQLDNPVKPAVYEIGRGTQEPGFKAVWKIKDSYIAPLIERLKKLPSSSKIKQFNSQYNFLNDKQKDVKLVLTINAKKSKNDIALSEIDSIKIKKYSISKWVGNLYLRFNNMPADNSDLKISSDNGVIVDVEVDEYKSGIEKTTDFLNKLADGGLFKSDTYDVFKKQKNDGWDRIAGKSILGDIGKVPGAKIKCIVTLSNEFNQQSREMTFSKNKDKNKDKNKKSVTTIEDAISNFDEPDITTDLTINKKLYCAPNGNKFDKTNEKTNCNVGVMSYDADDTNVVCIIAVKNNETGVKKAINESIEIKPRNIIYEATILNKKEEAITDPKELEPLIKKWEDAISGKTPINNAKTGKPLSKKYCQEKLNLLKKKLAGLTGNQQQKITYELIENTPSIKIEVNKKMKWFKPAEIKRMSSKLYDYIKANINK